jgi:hypothetical protein
MSTLLSLALTHTTTLNNTYNEATQIARAALMEGNGAVLQDYYTFEEYIARRGNFIIKLPEYKHLRNACWVVRKNDAHLIFADEQQQLTVREVRRRELADEIEPLLPLPTTSNTQSIDNFRYCRPEGWPEWRADELGGGLQGDEWYVKTPGGGSEAFFTPATSPVEGGLVPITAPDAISSTTVHAEPLQQSGTSPARLLRSHGLDVNRPASTVLPGVTVTNNERPIATQQNTNVQGIDRLSLSTDYSLKTPPTASGYLSGFHTSHEEHNRQPNAPQAAMSSTPDNKVPPDPMVVSMLATRASYDPELRVVMGEVSSGRATPEQNQVFQDHVAELGAVIQSQRAEEQRRWAMHNAAVNQGRPTIANSETPTRDQAQAAPATSLPGPSTIPLRTLKPNWKELVTKSPQATTTITSSLVAPEASPGKEKIFTPHPDVSSMAGYSIVAPVKNNTKNMGDSALKAATPVKNKEVPKDKAEPVLKPATPIVTVAAPTITTIAATKSDAPIVVNAAHTTPIVAAAKSAAPVATMAAPTVPVPIIAAPKLADPVAVKAAHTTPIVAAAQLESLPETPMESVEPAQESVEPASKRFKGTRGVAHPSPPPETLKEAVTCVQKSDTPQEESFEPAPKRLKDAHGVAQPAPLPETPKEVVTSAPKTGTPLRSVEAAPESVEPNPNIQKGTRGVAQPVKKTPANRKKTASAKNTPTPAPATDSPSTADTKQAQRIAAVIAGTILPKSKLEARAAAAEHHTLLLAAHNAQPETNRRTSTRLVQKATNPDLMPFFFSRPPPDAKTGEQQDFIRCICGVQHDDSNHMICCDTCDVWQHSACVLPGATEAQVEKLGKWACTVCDPWGHREVLRGLRASASAASAT